ncbi:uncharacterized protein LOC123671279 [Harmonia axyridis]|uniref:uncharacterized protein LOC123671279 n=1 Tax=Harmonia axyridis TaxID=115357 RepID=UPI001E278FD5|nr:uncharacterized protein LOC123671279 [Harmonia axyridis]
MKISCKNNSPQAKLALKSAIRTWIKLEMKKWYKIRDNNKLHLKVIHSELTYRISPAEFDHLDFTIREEVRILGHKQYENQLKKLEALVNNVDKFEPNSLNYVSETNKIFYEKVINFTDVHFEEAEIKLLEKGLKHCPNVFSKNDLKQFAVNVELALNKIEPPENRDLEKSLCARIISKATVEDNKNESLVLKQIKKKASENDLIITKADKGNTVTFLNRNDYLIKTESLLNSNNFLELKFDPTSKFQTAVKKTIKSCPNLLSQVSFPLTIMNPRIPLLYALPKIHKENCPMRPIVSYTHAPSLKLCKFLNSMLPEGSLATVLEHFNSYNTHLQFTAEEEVDNSIPFLDIRVIRMGEVLRTDWYNKPSSSGRYLHYRSCHPQNMKLNLVTQMKTRVLRLTHPTFHSQCIVKLKKLFVMNGYPIKLLNKLLCNTSSSPPVEVTMSLNTDAMIDRADIVYATIPYIPG